jgi:hypothetical protein
MKFQPHSKAAAVLIGGMGLAMMTGGTAYAYWTTTGSGTGSAQAATLTQGLTVQAEGSAPTGLYPTGSVTGTMRVTNPHPFAISITTAGAQAPAFGATSTGAGCNGSTVTFSPGAVPAGPVAAGRGTWTSRSPPR